MAKIPMLQKLQRIARATSFLRIPAIILGFVSLGSVIFIVLTSRSHEGDRYLIPSILALFWTVNAHTFITTFQAVELEPSEAPGRWNRFKNWLARGWYWTVATVFLSATAVVLVATYQMVSFWLNEY